MSGVSFWVFTDVNLPRQFSFLGAMRIVVLWKPIKSANGITETLEMNPCGTKIIYRLIVVKIGSAFKVWTTGFIGYRIYSRVVCGRNCCVHVHCARDMLSRTCCARNWQTFACVVYLCFYLTIWKSLRSILMLK